VKEIAFLIVLGAVLFWAVATAPLRGQQKTKAEPCVPAVGSCLKGPFDAEPITHVSPDGNTGSGQITVECPTDDVYFQLEDSRGDYHCLALLRVR
jgi:hypothetical protein